MESVFAVVIVDFVWRVVDDFDVIHMNDVKFVCVYTVFLMYIVK